MGYGLDSENVDNKTVFGANTAYFKMIAEGTVQSSSNQINGSYTGYAVTVPAPPNINPLKCLVFIQPLNHWIASRVFSHATGVHTPFHYITTGPNISFKYRIFYLGKADEVFMDDGSRWGMELYGGDGTRLLGSYEYLMNIVGHVKEYIIKELDYSEPNQYNGLGYSIKYTYTQDHPVCTDAFYCLHMGIYQENYREINYDFGVVYPRYLRQVSPTAIEFYRDKSYSALKLSTDVFQIDMNQFTNSFTKVGEFGHKGDLIYSVGAIGSYEDVIEIYKANNYSGLDSYTYAKWQDYHADETYTRRYMVMAP